MKKKRKIKILRRGLDNPLEKKILTAMITSEEFITGINGIYKPEYMMNDYTKKIANWCIIYYRDNHTCPRTTIADIFELEKESMDPAESKIIEKILSNISDEYDESEDIDADFLLKKAKDHFDKRSVTVFFDKGKKLVSAGRVDKAKELIDTREEIGSGIDKSCNLLSEEVVKLINIDTGDNKLFKFDGKLGDATGWFEKGWLISFLGPMKRGKTWMLMYTAYAAVEAGLKVLFVSLEMNLHAVLDRLYSLITGASQEGGIITVPTFDCYHNQVGDCRKEERVQRLKLIIGDNDEKPEYKPTMRYRPCAVCREASPDDYEPETWFERVKTKKKTNRVVTKAAKTLKMQTNGDIRCIVYPAFSATVTNIKEDINTLYIKKFKPDVVIIDHADILAPERHISERGNIDLIWKSLKQLAGEKNCAVFTASQANRASIEQESLRQINVAEDIRKLAHVDIMFGINQTEDEYNDQSARISTIAHRHKRGESYQVRILQALDIGQPVFDSE